MDKLDLSLFYSLQQAATKLKSASKSLEDLISAVTRACREYDIDQLAMVHALTYVVYCAILENLGSNQYAMPHTGILVRETSRQNLNDRTVSNALIGLLTSALCSSSYVIENGEGAILHTVHVVAMQILCVVVAKDRGEKKNIL